MAFLHFFDELTFNENGSVCETKSVDLNKARSNFLYLICKYNQEFLAEKGDNVPTFFKEELADILADVEQGKSYENAKKKIFAECLPVVKNLANCTEEVMVSRLNEEVSFTDKALSKQFENDLHKNYVETAISGKLFDEVEKAQKQMKIKPDKKIKSELFKKMIKFNRLASAIEKNSKKEMSMAS